MNSTLPLSKATRAQVYLHTQYSDRALRIFYLTLYSNLRGFKGNILPAFA